MRRHLTHTFGTEQEFGEDRLIFSRLLQRLIRSTSALFFISKGWGHSDATTDMTIAKCLIMNSLLMCHGDLCAGRCHARHAPYARGVIDRFV